jgi:BMFP domain-containing protein YqiC
MVLVFRATLRYQAGMSEKTLQDLVRKLADAVPDGLQSVRSDLEKNFRSVLQSGLDKLELVTREEFEVQEAVLQRTREKLEALEERLKDFEEKL